jgi:hypothetical protein
MKFHYCKLLAHTDTKFSQILYIYTVCCCFSCIIIEMTTSISCERLMENKLMEWNGTECHYIVVVYTAIKGRLESN